MNAMTAAFAGEANPSRPSAGSNSTSLLGNFLRGRPTRSSSHSQPSVTTDLGLTRRAGGETSPSPPSPEGRRHGERGASPTFATTGEGNRGTSVAGGGFSGILRRRRSAGQIGHHNYSNNSTPGPSTQTTTTATINHSAHPLPELPDPSISTTTSPAPGMPLTNSQNPAAHPPNSHRIRLVPHLDSRRSLRFDPITRTLKPEDPPLKIGRFTDRTGLGLAAVNAISNNKLAFKSKVVSRTHAEISVEHDTEHSGWVKFFIKDTKSSSGTFLNHLRLSPAGSESRKFELHDGDILQLGVDYQGGTEDIYKSVKIRIELGAGREWQASANAFNMNAMKNLKSLATAHNPAKASKQASISRGNATSTQGIPDCCICLFAVSIRQALFIAPCSHTFHYKCIRPLLESHHPSFSCPLCRTYADLEEDVEVEQEEFLVNTSASTPPLRDGSDEEAPTSREGNRNSEDGDIRAAMLASEVLAAAAAGGSANGDSGTFIPGGGNTFPFAVVTTDRERERYGGVDTDVEDFHPSPTAGASGTIVAHAGFGSASGFRGAGRRSVLREESEDDGSPHEEQLLNQLAASYRAANEDDAASSRAQAIDMVVDSRVDGDGMNVDLQGAPGGGNHKRKR